MTSLNKDEEWEKEFEIYCKDGLGKWISAAGVIEVKHFIRPLAHKVRNATKMEVVKCFEGNLFSHRHKLCECYKYLSPQSEETK